MRSLSFFRLWQWLLLMEGGRRGGVTAFVPHSYREKPPHRCCGGRGRRDGDPSPSRTLRPFSSLLHDENRHGRVATSPVSPRYVHPPEAAAPTPRNHTSSADDDAAAAAVSTSRSDTAKTCILLNTNARSVTTRVVETARAVFGSEHVFVTRSAEEARRAAEEMVRRDYALVIPVGGDGTLSGAVNVLCAARIRQYPNSTTTTLERVVESLPAMAYIPLGTGNGVGSVVGNVLSTRKWGVLPRSRRSKARQLTKMLQRLRALGDRIARDDAITFGDDEYERIDLPMMEVTTHHSDDTKNTVNEVIPKHGDLCFFAGVGFDSLMLNDFKHIKAWSVRSGFLTKALSSVAGYCVALIVRTLPQTVWQGRHNIHVQVTTPHVDNTLWVDHRRGDVVRPVPDALLYDGVTGILAAGTSPFYGGGLRLFPFARLTVDQMHLRIGRIHPLTGFLNIPQIFAGTYRDKSDRLGCLDFIGDEFQVRVEPAGSVMNRENDGTDQDHANGPEKSNGEDGGGSSKGYPFQHSGESVGLVERFRLRVVKEPVRFVCLRKEKDA